MIENAKQLFSRLGVDVQRMMFIIAFVSVLGLLDGLFELSANYAYLTALISSTSIVLLVAAVSHITRRILFPDLDLKSFAKEALGHPVASAVVFLAICIVLSCLIIANILLLS